MVTLLLRCNLTFNCASCCLVYFENGSRDLPPLQAVNAVGKLGGIQSTGAGGLAYERLNTLLEVC